MLLPWQLFVFLSPFLVPSSAQDPEASDDDSFFLQIPSKVTIGSTYDLSWQQDFTNGYDLYVTTDGTTSNSGRKVASFKQSDDQTYSWKADLNNTGWDPKNFSYIFIFLSEDGDGDGYVESSPIPASPASSSSSSSSISSSSTASSTSMTKTQSSTMGPATKSATHTSTPTSTSTAAPSPPPASPSHTGAIAGGVVGGVAGVAALAGALLLLRRLRKKPDHPEEGAGAGGSNGDDPYATKPMLDGPKSPSPWAAVLPKFARSPNRNTLPSVVEHSAPPYSGYESPPGQQKTFYDAGVASAAGVAGGPYHPDDLHSPSKLSPPGTARVVSEMTTISRISELPSEFPHRGSGGSIEPVEIGSSDFEGFSPRLSPLGPDSSSNINNHTTNNDNDQIGGNVSDGGNINNINDVSDDEGNLISNINSNSDKANEDTTNVTSNGNSGGNNSPTVARTHAASSSLASNAEIHLPGET